MDSPFITTLHKSAACCMYEQQHSLSRSRSINKDVLDEGVILRPNPVCAFFQGENGPWGTTGLEVWDSVRVSRYHLVLHGSKKSKLLFKSGKWRAEALMTSVGFGVTLPRTCCFRQMRTLQYKHLGLWFCYCSCKQGRSKHLETGPDVIQLSPTPYLIKRRHIL